MLGVAEGLVVPFMVLAAPEAALLPSDSRSLPSVPSLLLGQYPQQSLLLPRLPQASSLTDSPALSHTAPWCGDNKPCPVL